MPNNHTLPARPALPQLRLTTPSLPSSLVELERTVRPEEVASRTPTLRRALTPAERSILSRLVDEVAPLAEAKPDPETALAEVGKLFCAFPAASLSTAATEVRMEAYESALEDVPAWAVAAAGKRWIRGEVTVLEDRPNLSFPPSPPQLRALAVDEWSKARGALWRYRRLLQGKAERVVPPEERRAPPKAMLPAMGG